MDEKQMNTIVSETAQEQAASTPPSKKSINFAVMVLMAVVFLAVGAMVALIAKQAPTLTTAAQKWMYPVFAGVLIGGLTALWLYYQANYKGETSFEQKPWFFPVFSGVLTLIVTMIAYIAIGMWPIGEESAMIVDMHHQYAPMLSQLRDMLLNGGSVMYTFEVGTGTAFIPLFAYYLASPFNLFLILFPQAYLAEGILLITLLKIMLTGAFMTLCVQYIFKRRDFSTVAIGLMYALMMYMLSYSWDIMWLDCVMVLPLCVMGFEKMMRTGKYLQYVLSLAYILYSNYYIGFMVCIFLVLYFAVFFFRARRNGIQQAVGFARFAIGSLLGGGLAAFILLPAFMSLGSTSAAGGSMPEFATNFNVFELIGRGLFAVEPTIRSGNLPNTYCGVLAILTLPIFATMGSVPLRRRLAYLGLFGFMTISLVINQIDLVWHGMHSPNDLPYRYSFLYSFALLLIAVEVLYRIQDIKPLQIGGSIFGIAVYLILEENFGSEEYSYVSLYISFALILIYGLILLLVSQKKMVKQVAFVLLMVIVTTETMFNASETFRQMNNNEHYTNHADYLDNDITQAVQATVDRMEEIGDAAANGDFYRMEFLPRRTTADTALFDYRGITVFASSGSYNMTRFMGSMGYDVNGVNSQLYKSFVPTADALLGLKYIALEADLNNHAQLKKLEKVQVGTKEYYIYENQYVLPLGFVTNEAVKDWNYSYYDPMSSQNSLYKAMTSSTGDVLQCAQITAANPNLASVNGLTAFSVNGSQTAVFKANALKTGQVFIHVDCRAAKSITVSAGGNTWGVTTYEPYIIDAGTLDEGTEVTVTITSENSCAGNVYVASLNEEEFKKDIETLSASPLVIDHFDDSNLYGKINAQQSGVLMTTVEFDKGWTVKVDGKKVETYPIGSALMAFDIEAGEHEIEMTFSPKGFLPGIVISVVSLVALVFLLDYIKRRDTGKGIIPFIKKKTQGADET